MMITILMKGGILCDSVYSMFDEDNSGSMDFAENMTVTLSKHDTDRGPIDGLGYQGFNQAKFAMMMSTPEEKLSWIFEIFDSDGGNLIISHPMKEPKC